jgi:hypothetical protein
MWLCLAGLGIGLIGFWIGAMTCYYLVRQDSREDLGE